MKGTRPPLCILAIVLAAGCGERQVRAAGDALARGDLEQARRFYEGGLDPDARFRGLTALTMAACHAPPETIELLLDAGADPDLPGIRGVTALIRASRCGNLPVVRLLLERGADPGRAGPGGETALSAARAAGADDVVALLLDQRGRTRASRE